jgi:hypothetical protein
LVGWLASWRLARKFAGRREEWQARKKERQTYRHIGIEQIDRQTRWLADRQTRKDRKTDGQTLNEQKQKDR